MRRLRPLRCSMARRQNLLFRLLGMVAWAVTLAVLLTVMLRAKSSQQVECKKVNRSSHSPATLS
jgi:hypothetical protein